MFQKIILKTTLLCCFVSNSAFALTVEEAVLNALRNGDDAKKIASDISSYTTQKTSGFEKVFLPEVYLGYNRGNTNPEEELLRQEETKSLNVEYALSNIYKGTTSLTRDIASINAKKYNSKQEKIDLILGVIKLYFGVLQSVKKVELQERALKFYEKIYEQTKARVERGAEKRSAFYLAQSEVEEAKATLAFDRSQLEIEKNKFFVKVGVKAEKLKDPTFQLLKFRSLDEFIKNLEEESLKIKTTQYQAKAAKYDLASSSTDFLPDISITLQKYSVNTIDDNQSASIKRDGHKVSLNARFYLYKPGLISDVIKKGYEYRSSKYSYSSNLSELIDEAKSLWSSYEYHKSVLPSKENLVKIKTQIINDYKTDYTYGRVRLSEVLDQEKSLTQAELDLLKVKFEALENVYKMKSLQGEIFLRNFEK